MPLIHSASPKAVGPNITRERDAGKPYRQALAIALSTQDRARRGIGTAHRYASGGTPRTPTYATAPPPPLTSAGLMAGAGGGDYQIDPNTGALTANTLANLQSLAQRGLTINGIQQGMQAPAVAAPATTPADPIPAWLESSSPGFAAGGTPTSTQMAPWFVHREATEMDHPTGLVASATPGRRDVIPLLVAAGSYVVPADVVSGISEGNTLAGARHLEAAMHTGPGGIPLAHLPARSMMPHPPAISHMARGGMADGQMPQMIHPHEWAHRPVRDGIPVIVAGGEYIYGPDHVRHIGDGDLTRGHDRLDHLVRHVRAKNVRTTAKLPGPKKANEK